MDLFLSLFFHYLQERDYNTLLPDYEEAIAQSMKQPPPPYCQVAMTTPTPMVANSMGLTANENPTIMPSGTQAIPSTCDDVRNKIPPAYEENSAATNRTIDSNNTASSMEIRSIPNALDHAQNEASSLPSSSSLAAANDSNVATAQQRQPNH